MLLTTGFIPGPFAGLNPFDLGPAEGFPIQTALDVITGSSGFLFNGLYNFCIGASPADIASRNAANLCGPRATLAGPNTSAPLASPTLGGANFPGNPAPDLVPYDNRFISPNIDRSYANGPGFSNLESYGGAGTVEFDLAQHLTLKSITAYRELHWNAAMDLDGAPIPALQVSFIMNQWQFSQEVQLLGNLLDDRLNFVLGGYYFKESGDLHDLVPFIEGLLQVDGPNTLATENYAAFGQLDWRIAPWLGITLGGRYTHENKAFEGGQSDRNGFNYDLFNCPNYNSPLCVALVGFNDPAQPLRYYVEGVNHKHFNNFSPRAGIQLHPNDNIDALRKLVARLQDGRLDDPPLQSAAHRSRFRRGEGRELRARLQILFPGGGAAPSTSLCSSRPIIPASSSTSSRASRPPSRMPAPPGSGAPRSSSAGR